MRALTKRALKAVDLDDVVRTLATACGQGFTRVLWRMKRALLGKDKAIVARYMADHPVRKLHLGCGKNLLDGWLNSDYYPRSRKVIHVDATRRFPFPEGQFDYAYSEHMIEHITYLQGLHMLRECFRVLRPNGKLRISTPNLGFLVNLYRQDKSDLQQAYMQWSTAEHVAHAPSACDTFVINNFVRDWGHQFIYDEKVLRQSFEAVGFTDVRACALNESDDEHFFNLENEGRMPDGFLRLESLIVEGTKPVRP